MIITAVNTVMSETPPPLRPKVSSCNRDSCAAEKGGSGYVAYIRRRARNWELEKKARAPQS